MTKSERFIKAWEMARAAVVKFGGKVKQYFAECLKATYAPAVATKEDIETILVMAGAKVWEKNGIRRIYFNGVRDLVKFMGYRGKPSKRSAAAIDAAKQYFDCNTGDMVVEAHFLDLADVFKDYCWATRYGM